MRLHGAEALSAASNIFLDVGPAFFTFAPDAGRMNRPGRYFMLRLGDDCVDWNVLTLHVLIPKELFPAIAGHLVPATILSAPANIVMARIIWLEGAVPAILARVPGRIIRNRTIFS